MAAQTDTAGLVHRLRDDLTLMQTYSLPGETSASSRKKRNLTEQDIGALIHIHAEGAKFYAGYIFNVENNAIELAVTEPKERGRKPSLLARWTRGFSARRVYADEIISYKLCAHYTDVEKRL